MSFYCFSIGSHVCVQWVFVWMCVCVCVCVSVCRCVTTGIMVMSVVEMGTARRRSGTTPQPCPGPAATDRTTSTAQGNPLQPHAEAHTKSHIHTDTHPLTHTAQGNVISMILLNPLLFWDN